MEKAAFRLQKKYRAWIIRRQFKQLVTKNRSKTELSKMVYTLTKNRVKAFVTINLLYKIKIVKKRLVIYPAFIQLEIVDQAAKKPIFSSLTRLQLFGFSKLNGLSYQTIFIKVKEIFTKLALTGDIINDYYL